MALWFVLRGFPPRALSPPPFPSKTNSNSWHFLQALDAVSRRDRRAFSCWMVDAAVVLYLVQWCLKYYGMGVLLVEVV